MKPGEHHADSGHKVFEILELYTQDHHPWVRYINTQTLEEYTCLEAAFLARFYLQPS
jgi:hypothetical protein